MTAASSDGILNTSVTWADFECNLRSALGTEATLGPNKSVVDIGDGVGLVSCCGLISCDWVGATEGEDLPKAVVLKIPSILPLRKMNSTPGQKFFDFTEAQWAGMESAVTEIHNTEVATYEFTKEFEGLTMPRMYYGKAAVPEDGVDGQICIEYIDNTRTMNFYKRNTVEQVKQIARALGKIQACSLKKEPTSVELQKDFFKKIVQAWPLEGFRAMFKAVVVADGSEKTRELMEKIDALVPVYYGSNLPTSIHRQMGFRPVLVSGDLHAGNILIDKDTENLASIVDWQGTHLGVGVEDLNRISISSLTTKDRRESMPEIVEAMYNSLVENLDGVEPPYSLQKLLLISDLVFPQCALLFVGQFVSRIAKTNNDPELNDDEKAARIEVMLDKIIGALEDVVQFDIKNKGQMENLRLVD